MPSLAKYFPLPFTCLHESYEAGAVDADGNATTGWSDPVSVACTWQPAASNRSLADESVTTEQTSTDLVLIVESSVQVDHRDRFTVQDRPFEVVGIPKDYDHGPYGDYPERQAIDLRFVG